MALLGERIRIQSDLVVLATGMVPNSTTDLNLQYRLGKGLPEIEYDFSDSHFICFPYETRRTGIYAAGTVRAPHGHGNEQGGWCRRHDEGDPGSGKC